MSCYSCKLGQNQLLCNYFDPSEVFDQFPEDGGYM